MQHTHYKELYEHEMSHWWYRVRRTIVGILLKKYAPQGRRLRILDVGCGTGGLMMALQDVGDVYGVDMSDQAVLFCQSRGLSNVQILKGEVLPFEDSNFDVVLALDVLEHIHEERFMVAEIRRVLRPDGVAVIFVPAFMFLWSVTDIISHHFRRYRKAELLSVLRAEGLSIVRSSYFNFFLFIPILLARYLVRLFRIEVKSENRTGNGLVNTVLFMIFNLESVLIPHTNFPFGVSLMVVCRKSEK